MHSSGTSENGPERIWTRQACSLVAAAVVALLVLLLAVFGFMLWYALHLPIAAAALW
jgi:hypothetical protein